MNICEDVLVLARAACDVVNGAPLLGYQVNTYHELPRKEKGKFDVSEALAKL